MWVRKHEFSSNTTFHYISRLCLDVHPQFSGGEHGYSVKSAVTLQDFPLKNAGMTLRGVSIRDREQRFWDNTCRKTGFVGLLVDRDEVFELHCIPRCPKGTGKLIVIYIYIYITIKS